MSTPGVEDRTAEVAGSGEVPAADDLFADPHWALAFSWTERLESLRQKGYLGPTDTGLAERRIARWRGKGPFKNDPTLWERRLAAENLEPDTLTVLLGETPEAVHARLPKAPWLDELRAAYGEEGGTGMAEPFPWPESTAEARTRCLFLPLAEPLVARAHRRLLARAQTLCEDFPDAPFTPKAAGDALLANVPDLLNGILGQALTVEMHGAARAGRLLSDTPEARFAEFVTGLRRREVALDILAAYPVLARRLVNRLRQWSEAGGELLERLARDAGELCEHFTDGAPLGDLCEARANVSDRHHDGRGVVLLGFDSGLRLAYKPRPLAIEAAFQDLLTWIARRGFEPAPRVLRILGREGYGWMEFVAAEPCPEAGAVRRFYCRQGVLLGLFHLLDGTDFHYENLVAAGEHPVPVDLETLFHPWVQAASLHDLEHQAGASLAETPLRVGLLPQPMPGGLSGIDISGLGARPGQMTPKPQLAPVDSGTDAMYFAHRHLEMPVGENLPRLEDDAEASEVALLEHTEPLEKGFAQILRFALRHRDPLLATDGPLAAFADAETRVVLRPSAGYGALLAASAHPHAQSNALERRRIFDTLWAGIVQRPFLEPLLPHEIHDLERDDLPRFRSRPGSRELWSADGEPLGEVFDVPPLERTRARLASLDENAVTRLTGTVRAAFEALRMRETQPRRPSYAIRARAEPATREELLAAARGIGDELITAAYRNSSEALWLSVEPRPGTGWELAPAGPDLYLGQAGIAFFLAHLGEVTGEPTYGATARLAIGCVEHMLAQEGAAELELGGFNGVGGLIYTLAHLAVLWDAPELIGQAEGLLEGLEEKVHHDANLDLATGTAGLLAALLGLAAVSRSPTPPELAALCGQHLLAAARRQEIGGVGWPLATAEGRALAGISHGVAGIALALLRLTAATGDPCFADTARQALVYERALFDPVRRNWPDLRPGALAGDSPAHGEPGFPCTWCHGAPGVGLARLAGLAYLDDTEVRNEIAVAVTTTLAQGFGLNHCLCHGDLGNLELPLEASRWLEDPSLACRVRRIAGGILDGMAEHGRLYGTPGNLEAPGLMVGLAGMGYGLLRLAAPHQIPSVLTLEPPQLRRQLGPGNGGSAVPATTARDPRIHELAS